MAHEITMPASGQTAAESLIVRWNVAEGDEIRRGDVLFEIETDKATMKVESFAQGTLLKIVSAAGEKVEAGKVVAYIGKPGEEVGGVQPEHGEARRGCEEDEARKTNPGKTSGTARETGGRQRRCAGFSRGAQACKGNKPRHYGAL